MNYRTQSNRPKTALWGVVAAADLAVLGVSGALLLVTAGILVVAAVGTRMYGRRSRFPRAVVNPVRGHSRRVA